MRLVFEITDEDLREMVKGQVAAIASRVAEEVIRAQIDTVINKKFERISDERIQTAIDMAAAGAVGKFATYTTITKAIHEAASSMIRAAAK